VVLMCYAAVALPVPAEGFVTAGLIAGYSRLQGWRYGRAAAARRAVVLTVALAAGRGVGVVAGGRRQGGR